MIGKKREVGNAMYKLCKTDQSARRQRELEMGLLEAMKTQRYEDISISELCTGMQVPRKTFYRYFDSKDGCLFGLIDHTLLGYEGFDFADLASGKGTLQRELERLFLFWKGNSVLLDALRASGLSGVLIERAIGFALTDDLMPRRFLPDDHEQMQKHAITFGVCGLLSMVLSWHEEGFAGTAAELSAIAARLLGRPLFPGAEHLS